MSGMHLSSEQHIPDRREPELMCTQWIVWVLMQLGNGGCCRTGQTPRAHPESVSLHCEQVRAYPLGENSQMHESCQTVFAGLAQRFHGKYRLNP